MKIRHLLLAVVFVLSACLTALADRTLSNSEIQQIFQQLTSQPKTTWIPAGTVEATHSEYKAPKVTDLNAITARIAQKVAEYQNNTQKIEATEELQTLAATAIPFNTRYELANEYTMDSDVIVKYDGSRFYWEINVTGRNDSVRPELTLKTNYMTNQFNLAGNARRFFVWDGAKYTTYCLPINQARVDTSNARSHRAHGPLTAGVIPWGYGPYSLANLTAAAANAVETVSDSNQPQINLTLTRSNGMEIALQLDPSKNYAVISCLISVNNSISLQQYSGYQQVGSNWVPSNISLEQYDASAARLLSRDQWIITNVNGDVPPIDAFAINFRPAAMINYKTSTNSAICRQTIEKTGNCATSAIKYAASRLGKEISDKQLTSLVSGQGNTTDMLTMKNFVKNTGLYCKAVNADMQTLKDLKNCQVILHEPDKDHFVMLNGFDNTITKLMDPITNSLSGTLDLSKYTALVVSTQPVKTSLAVIPDTQLQTIVGAGYSCTRTIQYVNTIYCLPPDGTLCGSDYTDYWPLLGCEISATGTCTTGTFVRTQSTPCIWLPELDVCDWAEDWIFTYMRACAYGIP